MPRNPQAFGGVDFHNTCATHTGILTSVSSSVAPATPSPPAGTLPYHGAQTRTIHSFGGSLEPRWIVGAATHLTSELLRTLSRVAASKPTSWLSLRPDRLAHLVNTEGP